MSEFTLKVPSVHFLEGLRVRGLLDLTALPTGKINDPAWHRRRALCRRCMLVERDDRSALHLADLAPLINYDLSHRWMKVHTESLLVQTWRADMFMYFMFYWKVYALTHHPPAIIYYFLEVYGPWLRIVLMDPSTATETSIVNRPRVRWSF